MSDPFSDLGGLSLDGGGGGDNDPWGLLSGNAASAPAPAPAAAPEAGGAPVPSLMAKPVEEKKPVMKASPVPVMQAPPPQSQQPTMTMGQTPPPMSMGAAPPYGQPPQGAVPPGGMNAMVPVQTAPAAYQYNAFGTYGGATPAAMQTQPPPPPQAAPAETAAAPPAPVPPPAPAAGPTFDPMAAAPPPVAPADPFGAPAAAPPVPAAPAPPAATSSVSTQDSAPPVNEANAPADEDDFWAQMGFGLQDDAAASPKGDDAGNKDFETKKKARRSVRASVVMQPPVVTADSDEGSSKEKKKEVEINEDGLPSGGEYYTARVHGRRLGLMLGKARHLRAHLLSSVDESTIVALGDRPVVSYTAQDSATDHAGIHVGHVLLSVNGRKVKDPKDALTVIRSAQRPMELKFYSPNMPVTLAENQHMVKYDTNDLLAPKSQFSWKPKYVVIGGIIAQPWEMKMYYSKADYDKAVVERMSGRMVSVKVKTFDLRGAKLMPSSYNVKSVRYPNVRSEWHYFVVQTMVFKYPIKISHPVKKGLVPVHEGVRRVTKNRNY